MFMDPNERHSDEKIVSKWEEVADEDSDRRVSPSWAPET